MILSDADLKRRLAVGDLVSLYPGMRISQILLHGLKSPAERPYGTECGSKHQGSGTVSSRIGNDR